VHPFLQREYYVSQKGKINYEIHRVLWGKKRRFYCIIIKMHELSLLFKYIKLGVWGVSAVPTCPMWGNKAFKGQSKLLTVAK
jgi:hypothetical protein